MANRILFVGNGSYKNLGCEAIVRGTLKILRANFGDDIHFDSGIYANEATLQSQLASESDAAVTHFGLKIAKPRCSFDWFADQLNRRVGTHFAGVHSPILARASSAMAGLELGGDNYSLDYGIPRHFLEMDRYMLTQGIPVFIWGASIGPFTDSPEFEQQIKKHLESLNGVFVRESFSKQYLNSIGVEENVRQVADPAFLLSPVAPKQKVQDMVRDQPIGVNLSPLVARKQLKLTKMPWELTESDLKPAIEFSVQFIRNLLQTTDSSIVLVPHVFSDHVGSDDLYFLNRVMNATSTEDQKRVKLIPPTLNAAESKWIIGKCRVFVGARTHSTIASIGSGVPTLSLGYSLKARGLNQDVFDSQDWCLPSSSLTLNGLLETIKRMLAEERHLRAHLSERIPKIRDASLAAGNFLKVILERGK
ncbi:polysaccharide pyruvyl transferase family protein [Novipirellula caenicola]|uniref:Polysaccharide pyruvyl transferase domain-containing protein n=1 Tax=Novipirellula caenicola TaxID=1536901 RepID=A0ABP9W1Q6_9BACT